ncbi:MAG: hypothetical protein GQ574_23405 [Crocinitomix sp.]|nr:hypothetical protein [Crocinitomix sp.]
MHKQRLAVIIAAGVGVIASFLPWLTVTLPFFGSTSVNALSFWQGIFFLLLCGAAGTFAFLGDNREGPIDPQNVKFVAGGGAGAFLMVVIVLISGTGSSYGDVGGSFGIGLWIGLLAALAIVAVPFVIKDSGEFSMPTKDSIKDEFNEIKDK